MIPDHGRPTGRGSERLHDLDRRRRLRHAGGPRWRRARRIDRRGLAADLPDLDLRPGRRRAAARRLRVRRSQNPTRERLERAVAALEGARHGIAFASGSAATAAIAAARDRGRGDRRRRRRVRRHVPLFRAGASAGPASRPSTSTSPTGPDALWEALTDPTRLVWFETPTNPLLKVIDIAAVGAGGRRAGRRRRASIGRSSSSTTPSRRRRSSDRSGSAPTSCFTPPRSTSPATRTRSSALRSRAPTRSPSGCGSSRTRWAASRGRSTASSCCAGCGRCTCAWRATPRTEQRWRRSCAAGRTVRFAWRYPGFGGMVSFVPAAGAAGGRCRRARRRDLRVDAPVHAGGVARRGRIADRGAGRDDAPVGCGFAARS